MKIKFKNLDLGINFKKNKLMVYIISAIILLAIVLILYSTVLKKGDTTYLVEIGTLEHSDLAEAFVIKKETIIKRSTEKSLVPVVAEGQRVAKGGVIATYKSKEYDKNLAKLEQMDNEILDMMKDMPAVYSGEIESMENQIRDELKAAVGVTSYVEMQDYVNKINTLINKRAVIFGESTPKGAAIRKLINERNKFEENMKSSSDNVIATVAGLVSYKTDGLEESLTLDKINTITFDYVNDLMDSRNVGSNIKIIDNYSCYIIAKATDVNKEYIVSDKMYKLRVIGDTENELDAKLVSYIINNQTGEVDLTFEIMNKIENIASLRDIEVEIVWWTTSGMYVPNEAIYTKDNIDYVKIIKYGKYVEVPIIILRQNENNSVVDNYQEEELVELGLEREYILKIYDNIIVSE